MDSDGGIVAQEFGAWNVFRGGFVIQGLLIGWWALRWDRLSAVTNAKVDVGEVKRNI